MSLYHQKQISILTQTSDPESNFAVTVKLPHGPKEILMDCMLQGRMNFAKFSAEEATFASVGFTNFKLKTLAYSLQKFYQSTPLIASNFNSFHWLDPSIESVFFLAPSNSQKPSRCKCSVSSGFIGNSAASKSNQASFNFRR